MEKMRCTFSARGIPLILLTLRHIFIFPVLRAAFTMPSHTLAGRCAARRRVARCIANAFASRSRQTAEFTVASIHGKQHVILVLFAPEAPRANKGRQVREEDYEQVRTRSQREGKIAWSPQLNACNARFSHDVVVVVVVAVILAELP